MATSYSVMIRYWMVQNRATLLVNFDGKCWEIILLWDDHKVYIKNIDYYLAMELAYKQIRLEERKSA